MAAISPKIAAGPLNVSAAEAMSVPEAPVQALNEGQGACPPGSWQQAAGIFSAIANMLSADLTRHEMDPQSRSDLIQKLDELETALRNGGSPDADSLKTELARLEAELRAWRKIPPEGEVVRQAPAWQARGRKDGDGTPSPTEESQPGTRLLASIQATPSLADSFLDDPGAALASCNRMAGDEASSFDLAEGVLDLSGKAGLLAAEAEKDATQSLVHEAAARTKTISHPGDFMGSAEQLGHPGRERQGSMAQFGAAEPNRPLINKRGNRNRLSQPAVEASFKPDSLDALTRRIDAAHRQLAARLESGLAAAANETHSLRDLIAGVGLKIKKAEDAVQSRAKTSLEQEIAQLAGYIDCAGEGFASLASLRQAIDSLSVQLEETYRFVSGQSLMGGRDAPAGRAQSSHERDGDTQAILHEIADLRDLHADTWQRVHLALNDIQQSVQHISQAIKGRTGLTEQGLGTSPADPFAPILTSLTQNGHDGALATKVIGTGASNKKLMLAGEALRTSAQGKFPPKDGANGETMAEEREAGAASFLIEPGLGFPGRGNDAEIRGHRGEPVKQSQGREDVANRTDFIAAARRAARTAQREQQDAAAKSGVNDDKGNGNVANDGMTPPGPLIFRRRARGLLSLYKRQLILGGALLFAVIGAYALTTAVHHRFADFVPEFLHQFDRGAVQPKSEAARETSENRILASQILPLSLPSKPPRVSEEPSTRASALTPAASAAVSLTPLAQFEPGFSASGAARSGISPAAVNSARADRPIAGSDPILADRFAPSSVDNNIGRPRPSDAAVGTNVLAANVSPAASAPAVSPQQTASATNTFGSNLLEEAKAGNAAAQFDLALHYAQGSAAERNYELAAQWFGKAAEQGLAVAEYRLACLYEKGLGVGQDMRQAKNLYQRAAEKGNTRAMHNLGVLAVEGSGSKPNYTSAALWFGKAAEYGIRDSQYNLAVLLARGFGLPKDLVKSYTWFAIVAAAGDADAAKKRDEVATRLTSSELAAANAAAAAFEPRPMDRAANEAAPPAAPKRETVPAPQGQQVKPQVSGL